MLVIARREGEAVRIGPDIEIVVAQISGARVRLAIRAPREIAVITRQMKLVRDQNLAAAATVSSAAALSGLVARLSARKNERS